ncbi:MAG: cyclic nucleotide-binding domain-containing protein [Candidatus Accumulibacter sp.]|nr:cyclic nucleotide-binding domain-containing protein [Accumulibacter sp.]
MVKNQPRRVLILTSDSTIIERLASVFASPDRTDEYLTEHFVNPACALARAREQLFAVAICDLDPQAFDGSEFIAQMLLQQPACACVLLGNHFESTGVPRSSITTPLLRIITPCSDEEFRVQLAAALAQVDDSCRKQGRFDVLQPETLRASPLLAELSENQLQALAAVADWQTHLPGSRIVGQHDESDTVFVVVSGFVKITCHDPSAYSPRPDGLPERRLKSRRQELVALRGPGDLIGNVPSLLETGASTAALALTTCQVVAIPCKEFLVCIQSNPGFAQAVTFKIARNRIETTREVDLLRVPGG